MHHWNEDLPCVKGSSLLADDFEARVQFCLTMKNMLHNYSILKRLCFSDEAVFHCNGKVNTHNSVIWGYENPHEYEEIPMKSQGVAVWVALFHDKVVGPFIFDATANKENYLQMLQDFFVPHLKRLRRY